MVENSPGDEELPSLPLPQANQDADFVNMMKELNRAFCDESSKPFEGHILYIDAYDSFSNNIISLVQECLKVKVTKINIDFKPPDKDLGTYLKLFNAVIAGPGPGNPNKATDVGIMDGLWKLEPKHMIPVLGICLGFQSLCLAHGATVVQLKHPRHGHIETLQKRDLDIFQGTSTEYRVVLYNSLKALIHAITESAWEGGVQKDQVWKANHRCPNLLPLAWLYDKETIKLAGVDKPVGQGIIMAVRHISKPFWGVQFHPESCKSDKADSEVMLKNWWSMAKSWNQQEKRKIPLSDNQASPSKNIPTFINKPEPTVVAEIHDVLKTSTKDVHTRLLAQKHLTTAKICEIIHVTHMETVVLESKGSGGRFSIIPVHSGSTMRLEHFRGSNVCYFNHGRTSEYPMRSLGSWTIWDLLSYIMMGKAAKGGNPQLPFLGGFMGFVSYEMGLDEFNIPNVANTVTSDYPQVPFDVSLLWFERTIIIDHMEQIIYIQSIRVGDEFHEGWMDFMKNLLDFHSGSTHREVVNHLAYLHELRQPYLSNENRTRISLGSDREMANIIVAEAKITMPDEAEYKRKIKTCKKWIAQGDSYELCLTDETIIELPAEKHTSRPWVLYKELVKRNPAPYGAYAVIGEAKLICSSPELFMKWDRDGKFEMRPMKGTVKKTPDMTLAKATALLNSKKELAENLMIADLCRHDLHGTTVGYGNVQTPKLMAVEEHKTVYQLVTHVTGQLQPEAHFIKCYKFNHSEMAYHGINALKMCLAPGSMTGAPKKRSCEILQKIENRNRGLYSGVLGYLDVGGGGAFNVLIRTASCWTGGDDEAPEKWRIGAGGAITALSDEHEEWEEMLTKLESVLCVFGGDLQPLEKTKKKSRVAVAEGEWADCEDTEVDEPEGGW